MENNRKQQLEDIKEEVEYLLNAKKEYDMKEHKTKEDRATLIDLYQNLLKKIENESGRLQPTIEGADKTRKNEILKQNNYVEKNILYKEGKTVLLHPSLADMYEKLVNEIKPLYEERQKQYYQERNNNTKEEPIKQDVIEPIKEEEPIQNEIKKDESLPITNQAVTSPEIIELENAIQEIERRIKNINDKAREENRNPSRREANELESLYYRKKELADNLVKEKESLSSRIDMIFPKLDLDLPVIESTITEVEPILTEKEKRIEEITKELNEIENELNRILNEKGPNGSKKVDGVMYYKIPDHRRGYFRDLTLKKNRLLEEKEELLNNESAQTLTNSNSTPSIVESTNTEIELTLPKIAKRSEELRKKITEIENLIKNYLENMTNLNLNDKGYLTNLITEKTKLEHEKIDLDHQLIISAIKQHEKNNYETIGIGGLPVIVEGIESPVIGLPEKPLELTVIEQRRGSEKLKNKIKEGKNKIKINLAKKIKKAYESLKGKFSEIKNIRKPKTNIKEKLKKNTKKIVITVAIMAGIGITALTAMSKRNENNQKNTPDVSIETVVNDEINTEEKNTESEGMAEEAEKPQENSIQDKEEQNNYFIEDEQYKVSGNIYDNMISATEKQNPQSSYFGENTEAFIVGWGIKINDEMIFVSRTEANYQEKLENYLNQGGEITAYAVRNVNSGEIENITGFYNAEQVSSNKSR